MPSFFVRMQQLQSTDLTAPPVPYPRPIKINHVVHQINDQQQQENDRNHPDSINLPSLLLRHFQLLIEIIREIRKVHALYELRGLLRDNDWRCSREWLDDLPRDVSGRWGLHTGNAVDVCRLIAGRGGLAGDFPDGAAEAYQRDEIVAFLIPGDVQGLELLESVDEHADVFEFRRFYVQYLQVLQGDEDVVVDLCDVVS